MVGGKIVTAFLVFAVLFSRVTEWEHYPHYGGGNWIISRGDIVLTATSGGLLFSHYSETDQRLLADSGWSSPGNLSYDRVSHVVYDDDGNLWVSMNGGGIDVFSPLGSKTHYNQIDGLPLSLGINQTHPDTVIYAATTQGLCIKESGYFETWNTLSTGGGIPSDNINCISPSDSGLYVGTTAGLVFLPRSAAPENAASWVEQSLRPASIVALEWQNDTLWAATADSLFRKPPSLPWEKETLFPGGTITSLKWGSRGLAVGGVDQCCILEQGQWNAYNTNLGGNALTGLVWHKNRLCGVLTNTYSENRLSGLGLALLLENGSWRRTFPGFGPVSNDLRDCTILPDGSVWTSSNRAGASVFWNGMWQSLNQYLTSTSQCFAIGTSGSGVFVSSLGFGVDWLFWQDEAVGASIHFNSEDGLVNNRVYCIAPGDNNTVWFGHRSLYEMEASGISRLSWTPGDAFSASFVNITDADGLPSKEVNAVLPTGSRYCWVGTDGGLVYIDGDNSSVRETYTAQDGLPSSLVTSLSMDRSGTLFIGTASGFAFLKDGVISEVNELDMSIKALECDYLGSVWVSTSEGLKRYFTSSGTVEEYTSFNSPVTDGTIYAMTTDSERGYLWLATNHGFWRGTLEAALAGDGSSAVVYPDPFIPGDGAVLGVAGIPDLPTEIAVFDLTGNLVYEYSAPGRNYIAWNGSNSSGEPAASGVYFLMLQQQGSNIGLLKFALVR